MQSFKRRVTGVIGIFVTIWQDVDLVFDAVMLEFFSEMMRRADDIISVVGVIYHHGPHFSFGDGIGKIIISSNSNFVRNKPRMKPIKQCCNDGAKPEWDNVCSTHIFASVHDLERGDMEFFTQAKTSNRTTGFVVNIENIKLLDFGVLTEEPFFDNIWTARHRCDTTKEQFATGDLENVLSREFFDFTTRARVTGAKNIDLVAECFESLLLGVDGAGNAPSKI